MGSYQDPGFRPSGWEIAGDHETRIGILEAVPPETAADTYQNQVLETSSLLAYWKLEEASGNAIDSGPNGLDLNAGGTPVYGVPGPFVGKTAINFNNAGDFQVTNQTIPVALLNFTNSFTFEALVKCPATPDANDVIYIMSIGAAGAGFYFSSIFPTNKLSFYRGTTTCTSASDIALNLWTYVVGTYNGSTLSVYINGVLNKATADTTGSFGNVGTLANLAIGIVGTEKSKEYISNVAVYAAALSADTIAQRFAALALPSAPYGAVGGVLEGSLPNPGLAASVAGAGLAETADVLSVNVDNSTLEINADTLRMKDGGTTEAKFGFTDITTADASTTKHGLLKKLPNTATTFLDGTGAFDTVKDSDLSTSDITTNDLTTAKHGFAPKAPGDTAKFLRGDGAWATVGGSGGGVVSNDAIWDTKGDLAAATGPDAAVAVPAGTNGQVLSADSTQTAGLLWVTPTIVKIAVTTLGADAANIDLTSISGSYASLWLILYARTDQAATASAVTVRFNNDSAGNYYTQRAFFLNTTTTAVEALAATSARFGQVAGNTAGANLFGTAEMLISNYAGSTNKKSFRGIAGGTVGTASTAQVVEIGGGGWDSTAAINRITLLPGAAANFKSGTRATLYGLGA